MPQGRRDPLQSISGIVDERKESLIYMPSPSPQMLIEKLCAQAGMPAESVLTEAPFVFIVLAILPAVVASKSIRKNLG